MIYRTSGAVETTKILLTKVIEIGNWDMDAGNNVDIITGLPSLKVRSCHIAIINDTADSIYPLEMSGFHRFYELVGDIRIIIDRTLGGTFDNASFDSTPYNRGFVTIEYEE
jgi:hypothetical protein